MDPTHLLMKAVGPIVTKLQALGLQPDQNAVNQLHAMGHDKEAHQLAALIGATQDPLGLAPAFSVKMTKIRDPTVTKPSGRSTRAARKRHKRSRKRLAYSHLRARPSGTNS